MKITSTQDNGIAIIHLSGRFDSTVTDRFKEFFQQLCEKGLDKFVIDMTDVSYIDSGGLGSIVTSLRKIRLAKGDIKVASLSDKVRSIFQLTRFHRIIEIFDNSESAALSFDTLRDKG